MDIEKEILAIKERNRRVEMDKAWETSIFRTVTLTAMTYVVIASLMWRLGMGRPFVGAIIPSLGFFLSTQSLPIIKRWWTGRQNNQSS